MQSQIEKMDRKRMRYLGWYLVGFVVFIALSITRFFFRHSGLNEQPVGTVVLVGLILSLLVIAISTITTANMWRKIKHDGDLMEALQNELVQAIEVQSWKSAYLAAVVTTVFFAITSFFYPVCDPVLVALTSIIAGAGAHQATFYFKYRAS